MLVLVFVECSDHQLKYKQFKSEILAVQKSIKISIRRVVIILILKCIAQNQHVTPWNWKKIFPVTTMFIQKLQIEFWGQDKMFFTWKMFPFSNTIFIKRVQLSFFLQLQIEKVEKMFWDESILMQDSWKVIHLFLKNKHLAVLLQPGSLKKMPVLF